MEAFWRESDRFTADKTDKQTDGESDRETLPTVFLCAQHGLECVWLHGLEFVRQTVKTQLVT